MPLQKRGMRPNEGHGGAWRGTPLKRDMLITLIGSVYSLSVDIS